MVGVAGMAMELARKLVRAKRLVNEVLMVAVDLGLLRSLVIGLLDEAVDD